YIGRRSAAEAHDPALTTDSELVPEPLDYSRCLRLLARGNEIGGQRPPADDRELVQFGDPLVGDHRRVAGDLARKDEMERLEEQAVGVLSRALGNHVVEHCPLLQDTSELHTVSPRRT